VAAPLTTAFATCLLKGSASDLVAQVQVEKCERVDWRRNAAFALFSGAYLGIGQHAIYNVAFTRIFGTGTDLLTGLKKVIADSLVHVPLIYLPLYYPCVPRPPPPAPTPCSWRALPCALRAADKALVLGEGSAYEGLLRYRADVYDVMTTYWSMWPPRLETTAPRRFGRAARLQATSGKQRPGPPWGSASAGQTGPLGRPVWDTY
jgi:hypothetical protein